MEIAHRSQLLNQFYQSKFGQQEPSEPNEYPDTSLYYKSKSNAAINESEASKQESQRMPTTVVSQLLLLTVQIDENRTGIINVYENDDPHELAKRFCTQYGVNVRIVPLLAHNIAQNIEQALRERQNMKNYLSQKRPVEESIEQQKLSQSSKKLVAAAPDLSHNTDLTFSPKINRKSRKLAKNRSFDIGASSKNPTVYDRLFQDANHKKLRQQLVEQAKEERLTEEVVKPTRSRVYEQSSVNYGEVLYQRGLKQKEDKLQRIIQNYHSNKVESVKRERQSQLLQECSHQPQINEISRAIARRPNEPIGDHLNKIALAIRERKVQAKQNREQQEEQSCSFQPQLNKISQYIIEEKKKQNDAALPHYHSLYMDHKVRQQKIANLDQQLFREQHPFHPKVDEISEKIVHGTSFNERLQRYQVEKVHSKERSVMREQDQIMQESQLFRPKTGRPPENRSGDPFMHLYQHSILQAQSKAQKVQQLAEQQASLTQPQVSAVSQKLVDQQTISSVQAIFNLLDHDNDGVIDAQRIDVTGFERVALEVIGPLLLEMEEGHHSLNREEFTDSVLRLLNTLNVQEKHELLFRYRKRTPHDPSHSFHVQFHA